MPGAPAGGCRSWGRTTISGLPARVWLCAQSPVVSAHRCPNSPAGGRAGHPRRKMSCSPRPQTTVAGRPPAPGPRRTRGPARGLAGRPAPPSPPSSASPMARTPGSRGPGRLRLHFASSLGVGLTSKNEFEENRRRSRHAAVPGAHWPPVETLVFGVMFPEGLPSPLPSPPTSGGVGQSLGQAIKWLSARRAPRPEVSPPTGTGQSSDTQHVGTACEEDAAQ